MSNTINVLLKLPGEKLEAVSLDAELLMWVGGLHIDVKSDVRIYSAVFQFSLARFSKMQMSENHSPLIGIR